MTAPDCYLDEPDATEPDGSEIDACEMCGAEINRCHDDGQMCGTCQARVEEEAAVIASCVAAGWRGGRLQLFADMGME